jgi:L-amino acid N-acyltransferase YncA
MKLLMDTCVVIPAEPTSLDEFEPTAGAVMLMQRTCQRLGDTLYIHPASLRELERDPIEERRLARATLCRRYPVLESPPGLSTRLLATIGSATPGSHDAVDHLLLAAIAEDAVDYLVTNDAGLLNMAARAGLEKRVGTPAAILKLLEGRLPVEPTTRPSVTKGNTYELSSSDSIFDTFRTEYPQFDEWLARCKREHRPSWVVTLHGERYSAICIAKHEVPGEYGLPGKVLKVCSFKAEFGYGLGELLLQSLFDHAFANEYDTMYVEVLLAHGSVVRLFSQFGFAEARFRSHRGELVLVKSLRASPSEYEQLSPLDYNVRFGPQCVKIDGARAFVVPIRPEYHSALYPELATQRNLFPGRTPWGNAIRKAYLCHAQLREIPPGAILLFYRSQDEQSIRCVGVVEKAIRSRDPDQILHAVGTRTVYSSADIENMCNDSDVLAILYRHVCVVDEPWPLAELKRNGVLIAAPQSIAEVPAEARPWLKTALARWL